MADRVWVDERLALALYQRTLVLHGGAAGVRDTGLLQSALAWPQNLTAYDTAAGEVDLAAACTAGILQKHPFIDGNKRAGFLVGLPFLDLNGLRFIASEHDAAGMVIALAGGTVDEATYREFLAANCKTSDTGWLQADIASKEQSFSGRKGPERRSSSRPHDDPFWFCQ